MLQRQMLRSTRAGRASGAPTTPPVGPAHKKARKVLSQAVATPALVEVTPAAAPVERVYSSQEDFLADMLRLEEERERRWRRKQYTPATVGYRYAWQPQQPAAAQPAAGCLATGLDSADSSSDESCAPAPLGPLSPEQLERLEAFAHTVQNVVRSDALRYQGGEVYHLALANYGRSPFTGEGEFQITSLPRQWRRLFAVMGDAVRLHIRPLSEQCLDSGACPWRMSERDYNFTFGRRRALAAGSMGTHSHHPCSQGLAQQQAPVAQQALESRHVRVDHAKLHGQHAEQEPVTRPDAVSPADEDSSLFTLGAAAEPPAAAEPAAQPAAGPSSAISSEGLAAADASAAAAVSSPAAAGPISTPAPSSDVSSVQGTSITQRGGASVTARRVHSPTPLGVMLRELDAACSRGTAYSAMLGGTEPAAAGSGIWEAFPSEGFSWQAHDALLGGSACPPPASLASGDFCDAWGEDGGWEGLPGWQYGSVVGLGCVRA